MYASREGAIREFKGGKGREVERRERERGRERVELATLCLSRRSETRRAGATGRSLIHALQNDSSLVTADAVWRETQLHAAWN